MSGNNSGKYLESLTCKNLRTNGLLTVDRLKVTTSASLPTTLTVTGLATVGGLKIPGATDIKQSTDNTTPVTVNGMCGVIEMADIVLDAQTNVRFSVNNSSVLATSRIFLQVDSLIEPHATQGPHCCIDTVANGSFVISISNPDAANCTTPRIHFFIVNL